ncbi:MAG: glutathione S-transferase family protein [Stappiaceae bacterium]
MQLYNAPSGNTKRVRIFIAEKAINIPTIEMELGKDTRTPAFRKINSLGELPVLKLDGGQLITESRAICRYLDACFPENPLMGVEPLEQGQIAMWSDRIHSQLFMTYGLMARHTLPLFSDILKQVPEFAQSQRDIVPEQWIWLDGELSDGRRFIAGDAFSFADVEGMTVLMLADAFDLGIPDKCTHALKWAATVRNRPSFQA